MHAVLVVPKAKVASRSVRDGDGVRAATGVDGAKEVYEKRRDRRVVDRRLAGRPQVLESSEGLPPTRGPHAWLGASAAAPGAMTSLRAANPAKFRDSAITRGAPVRAHFFPAF